MKARDALRMDKPIVIRQLLRGIGKHVKAGLADFLDRCRPETCAASCNPSAAGNASRIWCAASSGEGARRREMPGGFSVVSRAFNLRFSTLPPPMRCMSLTLVSTTCDPLAPVVLHATIEALYTLSSAVPVIFSSAPSAPNRRIRATLRAVPWPRVGPPCQSPP